ncbi:MAG: hypothetical protein HY791_26975 [Deltaproteobacteria bacterium]|nr:hypothetical protein [Deltaproteobacteria bacterium]
MRTTVEISDEHRAELLKIASHRGQKGFSAVINEAITFYLDHMGDKDESVKAALGLQGILSTREADQFDQNVTKLRASWR